MIIDLNSFDVFTLADENVFFSKPKMSQKENYEYKRYKVEIWQINILNLF